jgi:predicted amidohydrolase
MKIATVQNSPVFGEKEKNINDLLKMMDSTGAELYILPEMSYSGYQLVSKEEVAALADKVDSDNIMRFAEWSKAHGSAVILGFPEAAEDGKIYNSSVFITPEGERYIYRKSHLFYKEKIFYAPGNTGFFVKEWHGVRIGQAICFDWYFSESFRTLALLGADLIAHCTNIVMPYFQRAAFARAIENKVYIATSNRIGTEERDGEKLVYTGESVIVDPLGNYLVDAPSDKTGVFTAEIDTKLSRNKKLNDFNDVIGDRRTIFYK